MSAGPDPRPPIGSGAPGELAGRPTVRSGATLVGAAQIAMAGLGALASILVARLLGPADMGAFNVIASAFLIAGSLSTLGLPIGFTYYVSRRAQNARAAVRQAQVAAVPLGLLVGAGVLGLAAATSEGIFRGIPLETLAVAMAFLPLSLSFATLVQISLACDRHRTYAIANVGSMVLYLALAAALTPVFGLVGAVFASTAPYGVASVILHVWLRRSLAGPSHDGVRRAWGDIRRGITFGVKSYATSVLARFNERADVFILNSVAIQATVGQYAIAVAVTSLGLLIPKALSAVVLPRVAALDDAPRWEQAMVVRKSARHALLIALAMTGLLAIGVLMIPVIYGSAFSPAVVPGLILAPGIAALGAATVLGGTTTGKGKPQYSLYAALFVTPPTIVGYLLLIPVLEATGAALASTASYGATLGLAALFFRRANPEVLSWREMLPTREEVNEYLALGGSLWHAGRLRLLGASGGGSGQRDG